MEHDGWGVQRRLAGRTPALLSISEVNAGTPPATGTLAAHAVRSRTRGRLGIAIAADSGIAPRWTPGAALFDPPLERALDWLARLSPTDTRRIELRLTLVPETGARRQERLHAADQAVVIDLLVPVADHPSSRSAALEAALATGLHEAAHALRPAIARDRDDDEYRAHLVAACFRIDSAQPDDQLSFATTPGSTEDREFTRVRSNAAAQAVKRDLGARLGATTLHGRDHAGIARLLAHCTTRLAKPAR